MNKSSPPAPTASRDLLTVDLRGMKPQLLACATRRGVSLSTLVREVLAQCGAGGPLGDPSGAGRRPAGALGRVRVSLRVSADEAARLEAGAREAGLAVGAYVMELMGVSGSVPNAPDRRGQVAALTRSSAELSTLSRNIAHLAALLRQGAGEAAMEYRAVLVALDGDVRSHLALASAVLSDASLRRQATRTGRAA